MEEYIHLKCPYDGAVLAVKNKPGLENMLLTCPVCKQKNHFSKFQRVKIARKPQPQQDGATQYPGGNQGGNSGAGASDEKTRYAGMGSDEATKYDVGNIIIGVLRIPGTGEAYQLRPGRNVIGRKGAKSAADFQIETGEKRNMSREHLVVEVKKVPGKGFVHYISLFKEKVNKTFVGLELLEYGDRMVLNHGDEIRMPDATLKFELPDEEGTVV